MSITVQKLLSKIEAELQLAKVSHREESLREKVYSIKILCELILDEKQVKNEIPMNNQAQIVTLQQPFQPSTLNEPKKLAMGDEANGESLLDF
ncbi:YwdI family protein [Neobacillus sp. PS3-40]|uniref:YwdI family protein n=1 Tax=Neobacillus sp. PS3-40 TaxID=3070679 RepID=UPI0027E10020|nr:YwdI family protein [Neobacillus sp. PS3-40]WML46295.1 YwdI family protein [Neobacillus sp. PS3-40]